MEGRATAVRLNTWLILVPGPVGPGRQRVLTLLWLQNFQFQTENQELNGNVPVVQQRWVIALVRNGGHGKNSYSGHERHGGHECGHEQHGEDN